MLSVAVNSSGAISESDVVSMAMVTALSSIIHMMKPLKNGVYRYVHVQSSSQSFMCIHTYASEMQAHHWGQPI